MSETPKNIGQYEVMAELGSGGMAEVYLGRHEQLGNAVAIKVLDARYNRDPSFRQRFVDEARIQANLKHPGILAVQDIIAEDDLTAIVMEYLEGIELSDFLKAQPQGLSVATFLALVIPLTEALTYAHDAGIVHRDIKPANVFLVRQGKQVVPKLMDFGIAKLLDSSLQAQQTAAGTVLGTPQFMAPEQFEDASTVDARADIFAFGTLMYLLLARRLPFRGEGVSETMRRILMDTPDALSSIREDLPPGLEAMVFRCLEKKPVDRFQDMAAVTAALQEQVAGITPVPLTPDQLPAAPDRDRLKEKMGLASTTGDTLTRSSRRTHTEADNTAATVERTGETTVQDNTPVTSSGPASAVQPFSGAAPTVHPGPTVTETGPRRGRLWLWLLLVVLVGGGAGAAGLWLMNQGDVGDSKDKKTSEVASPAKRGVGAESAEPVAPRREAAFPARAEAREPRGEWPALPAASKLILGSRLHHPPKGARDRHLSAILALGWEGLEPADLESDEEAALGITAGALAVWVRDAGRTPEGRRFLPQLEKAIAPMRGKGLKRSQLDHVMETLGSPDAAAYAEFQVRLQCETFRLVTKGDGDQLGEATNALLAEKNLTFEAFGRLKAAYGKDELLKAEIATRVLVCITD